MSARDDLLDAWRDHDRWARTLTLPPDKDHPNGRARWPGFNDGAKETNRLVVAEAAYAAEVGIAPIECGRRRAAARMAGATYEEALDAVDS